MKHLLKLTAYAVIFICLGGCVTSKQLTDTLIQLQVMDNICVSNVTYEIIPGKPGSTNRTIEFKAVLSNPSSEDGHGQVRLVMGVDASNLGLVGGVQSISANSAPPFFETPAGTTFAANQINSYTSPVLVSLPYNPGATYQIEIRKFVNPQLDSDGSSCHNFKVTKQL